VDYDLANFKYPHAFSDIQIYPIDNCCSQIVKQLPSNLITFGWAHLFRLQTLLEEKWAGLSGICCSPQTLGTFAPELAFGKCALSQRSTQLKLFVAGGFGHLHAKR
jgi:hypothetical protein